MADNRDNRVFAAMALARIISSPTFLMMIGKLGAAGGVSVFFGSIAIVLGLCIVNPVSCVAVCGIGAFLIAVGIGIGITNTLDSEPEIHVNQQGSGMTKQPSSADYSPKKEAGPKPTKAANPPPYNPALFQAAYNTPPTPPEAGRSQIKPSAPPLEKVA